MSDFPELRNPPSVESIIELRTSLIGPALPTKGREFALRLSAEFPHVQDVHFVTTQISIGSPGVSPEGSSSIIGARLETADRRWVVQAKADALSVSRLVPYTGWMELRGMVERLWPIYCEVFNPATVTRLGVRFLNRIALSGEHVDLDTLFTAGPKVPPSLPQILTYHQSRIVVPLPELSAEVAIVMASEAQVDPKGNPVPGVFLDIDAFADGAMVPQDGRIWGRLEDLRRAKNLAFFGSMYPETLKGFQ